MKSRLPGSSCARGAPRRFPFSAVRDFYALLTGLHKGLRAAISRFFNHPQTVHSSAEVIPLLARILHKQSTDWRRPSARLDWQAQFEADRAQQETSTIREGPDTIRQGPGATKGRAPPRMRWRGPPDLAAQTPLTHAQRPCRSISHQAGYPLEVPVARFPLRPGCPPVVPVFGGERFLRLFRAAAQGVLASNFKIF